ncbi:MAG TPA: SDR family oxidoreductase [Bryobacteraceae bacterium]|jgi:NAD(P)-dependent dehydrogenase (short-subunit alcohol dehydrogenase family)|nr:SDR family oxidoreductase [Bryobacteraceae bacterium]
MDANGKVSLVTGASRGIGAATALKLASFGSDVVINYRSKGSRAEEVACAVEQMGRKALAVQADLTHTREVECMLGIVEQTFGRVDVLVLNASGGLEKGKAEDYAMELNREAQLCTARLATKLMPRGGRIVFVTSHWAHFYGDKPVIPGYEVVAKSKHAGEKALREYARQLETAGISLLVVSGDLIEGTITPRLLERSAPGLIEDRRSETGRLPTVDEFADVIAAAALNDGLPSGHTIFVGATD